MAYNTKESKAIHTLLAKTIISPELFLSYFEKIEAGDLNLPCPDQLHPLRNYLKQHTPKKLYKFRSCSPYAKSDFYNENIQLTRGDKFNDPFECTLSFDYDKVAAKIEYTQSDECMQNFLSRQGYNDAEITRILEEGKDIRQEILSDAKESFPNIAKQLQKGTFSSSLTENLYSPVMWAHYADTHKGFAIEYELDFRLFCPRLFGYSTTLAWRGWSALLPVLYADTRIHGEHLADWYALCEMYKKGCLPRDTPALT